MRLFNVVQVYNNNSTRPECREIIVIKELPNTYLVESSFASGHRSRIGKTDPSVSRTEAEAWTKFIQRASQILCGLAVEYTAQSATIRYANEQLDQLIDDNIKIGGTC